MVEEEVVGDGNNVGIGLDTVLEVEEFVMLEEAVEEVAGDVNNVDFGIGTVLPGEEFVMVFKEAVGEEVAEGEVNNVDIGPNVGQQLRLKNQITPLTIIYLVFTTS